MKKILIVQANFYQHISKLLLEGAVKKITSAGFNYEIISVPGAFEIAAVIAMAQNSNKKLELEKKYHGYVALGCVIRGETTHYDYVCSESARSLQNLAYKKKLAIGYGILTVENEAQAIERADPNKKDKGGFAANTCIEMIKIKDLFS